MCRKSALAATALALCLAPPTALAKDRSKDKAKPAAEAAAPAARTKATTQERAVAQRMDPLARAAFWARETDIDPSDTAAGVNLAQALRAMGNYEEAAAAAQKTVAVTPDSLEGWLELARAHLARGQGFYAIEPARRAMALAPGDWRPVSLAAIAYEQASRDDEALAAHQKALAMAPDNPTVLCNAALYYAGHGDAARGEALLRAAAAKPGATAQVRQNLALLLGLEGRFEEAERLARQDLPPEMVAANMSYLRQAAGAGGAKRSWESLRATP